MKRKKIATLMCVLTLTTSLLACGSAETASAPKDSNSGSGNIVTAVTDYLSDTGISKDSAMDGGYIQFTEAEEFYTTDSATAAGSSMNMAPKEEAMYDMADDCYGYYEYPEFNTEEYNYIKENSFLSVATSPLSTFAADVDTGSYTNFRRMMYDGYRLEDIPQGAVRVEEMINYFDYAPIEYTDDESRFGISYETNICPWNEDHELLMLTVGTKDVDLEYVGNNFVFLIDSSGSMNSYDKGVMAIDSFKLLAETLTEDDRVSIVTYSGSSATILDSCPGNKYSKICKALDSIKFGGGTNGSGGITAAYELAAENFMEGGNNRVIIASDGDMNLGITSQSGLTELITEQKETGVFLTVLGYGSGNYSDANMESIADCGNGNYYYIDCLEEAERVLVDKLKQTTVTVAKDVKIQVEFNPLEVSEYRLIGYENRTMAAEDFEDDTKDGGETGAGQTVTVLYEIVRNESGETDSELRYQGSRSLTEEALNGEILTLSVRYKEPDGARSSEENFHVMARHGAFTKMSKDFAFAAGLAQLSMIINDSDYLGNATMDSTIALLEMGCTYDSPYREQLLEMLEK